MALLHQADITPTKIDMLSRWAPTQPWFVGDAGGSVTNLAAYRFDDPDGQVGIETIFITAGAGPVLQIPVTYRDAPLAGAETSLITTMQHSVLGERWVYDATGDPAYLAAVATAAITGGHQAELTIETDGQMVVREPTAVVAGSGTPGGAAVTPPAVAEISIRQEPGATVVTAGTLQIIVARVLGDDDVLANQAPDSAHEVLAGTWSDQPTLRALVLVATPA
ncbi:MULTISPECIES: hypothetical protein [unclassified Cryobacterium]|uniref:CG0192-related protein n=1 Tax=unclassified Cryobacterium TaxID=2649013 RepID=UPI001069A1F6|nr:MULTISPECIES: hypothetical protein [unclassified Cryobacterium]TFC55257.1 hypothetical protein E3O68_07295 [Cryobacterium sp. TMB3-1-2]TFC71142.1 hypothetical protein E3T21_08750 [Cryobacterium sp. TMB3-15]TFC77042.1 hypothetical protein E3T22_07085 [Cryobacterium sp. TMB3-10]TFD46735.1 hypothetical protein E3T58_00420 [Cryobacterium sp. TMB3-12]